MGRPADRWVKRAWPEAAKQGPVVRGTVVYADRFGNLITNVSREILGWAPTRWRVCLPRRAPMPEEEFYQAVAPGKLVGLEGSGGFLEIAVNDGAAARKLGLRRGDAVTLRRSTRRQPEHPGRR